MFSMVSPQHFLFNNTSLSKTHIIVSRFALIAPLHSNPSPPRRGNKLRLAAPFVSRLAGEGEGRSNNCWSGGSACVRTLASHGKSVAPDLEGECSALAPHSERDCQPTHTHETAHVAMKRNLSDSEVDDFDDDSKGATNHGVESCQMLNRKKRRGLIEKRRRDRINSSLTELRRLVPTAFEKQHNNTDLLLDVRSLLSPQGSSKLEKAEILQMTVDHLKMLHSKGLDALAYDPHKFAMDYHSVGFRECAAEVARYLVTMEGMDVQDPLRLRLMSHLQCYSAQRELATKPPHSSWVPPFNPTPQYSNPFPHMSDQSPTHHVSSLSCSEQRVHHSINGDDMNLNASNQIRMVPSGAMFTPQPPTPNIGMNAVSQQMSGSQYPVNLNISTHCFSTTSQTSHSSSVTTAQTGSPVKPYRPWGSEIAY
uniref:Hairy/enhancer-of-split related with YRPW motif protein n=1 Tax=Strigamia maritima TaxID=126957 RepID=T1JDP5_STRMM